MATAKITKTLVDRTTEPGFVWDADLKGFGLRISDRGVKTYIFAYRMGGRESPKRRFTIGKHGSLTPDQARIEAKRLALNVAQGIDPVAADKERRRKAVDLAFDKYVSLFATRYLKTEWKRPEEAERMLRREPSEVLGGKSLPSITKADITAVMDRLTDRPAVARMAFATLRVMFNWAVGRGEIQSSPLEGMKAPGAVSARDRFLSDAEIAAVWSALEGMGAAGDAYRLLILTGQRLNEVTGMRWEEIDRAGCSWTIPADRAKNGVSHVVPLAPDALAIVEGIADYKEFPGKGCVFPAVKGDGPMWIGAKIKKRLDDQIGKARAEQRADENDEFDAMPSWRNHDLRRTVATGLQRLGVRLEVTEAVLNHVSGSRAGIVGVYQRHDWSAEKRTALEAWAKHVMSVVNGADSENVVRLRA